MSETTEANLQLQNYVKEDVKSNGVCYVSLLLLTNMFPVYKKPDYKNLAKEYAGKWADENGFIFQRYNLDIENETYMFAPRK